MRNMTQNHCIYCEVTLTTIDCKIESPLKIGYWTVILGNFVHQTLHLDHDLAQL